MSRKDFISDNLVDMRERLKKNYEDHLQKNNVSIPETSDDIDQKTEKIADSVNLNNTAVENIPASGVESPVRKQSFINTASDDLRLKRELNAHIIHDLSAAEQERALLLQKLNALDKFTAVLNKIRTELQSTPGSEDADWNVFQKEYYSAKGTWSAFEQENVFVTGTQNGNFSHSLNDKMLLWVAAAILSTGIILSLVMIGIFS